MCKMQGIARFGGEARNQKHEINQDSLTSESLRKQARNSKLQCFKLRLLIQDVRLCPFVSVYVVCFQFFHRGNWKTRTCQFYDVLGRECDTFLQRLVFARFCTTSVVVAFRSFLEKAAST